MDKKLIGLVTIFLLLFGLFTSVLIFNEPLISFTRARDELAPSASKSIIFAWPLKLPADGVSKSAITVFVRNEKGGALSNKRVALNSTLGTLSAPSVVSNKNGKAEFTISSATPGVAKLQATIDGSTPVSQTVSIQFD